jgi:hypothetical protein
MSHFIIYCSLVLTVLHIKYNVLISESLWPPKRMYYSFLQGHSPLMYQVSKSEANPSGLLYWVLKFEIIFYQRYSELRYQDCTNTSKTDTHVFLVLLFKTESKESPQWYIIMTSKNKKTNHHWLTISILETLWLSCH